MILIDANVLLYGYHAGAPQHAVARRWLERTLSGSDAVCFSWSTVLAFLRISTNARVFEHPLSIEEAYAHVESWLDRPNVLVLESGDRYRTILRDVLVGGQVRGPLVSDAALAALAIEHGASLATTDRDFARFSGLQVIDPLRS